MAVKINFSIDGAFMFLCALLMATLSFMVDHVALNVIVLLV